VSKPPQKRLRPWTFAGLLLSYWCNARCEFCYACCGPEAEHWAAPAEVLRWWRQLRALAEECAGRPVRIHLTGGEPFGNWPLLLEIAQRAHDEGLTAEGSFEKVETNAFWAVEPQIVRDRISRLDRLDMQMLVVSADPYHQQFVPPEHVRICVETAREILGSDRVRVRWQDWYENMQDLRQVEPACRREMFRRALAKHRERLTGRAASSLTELMERRPADAFLGQNCLRAILASRHVHIDPYGNVFPGVCMGIRLGNANEAALPAIWQQTAEHWAEDPVLRSLVDAGPYGLLEHAEALGYRPLPAGYASKCHLCAHVRRFFFEKGLFKDKIGPAACYAVEPSPTSADPRNAQ